MGPCGPLWAYWQFPNLSSQQSKLGWEWHKSMVHKYEFFCCRFEWKTACLPGLTGCQYFFPLVSGWALAWLINHPLSSHSRCMRRRQKSQHIYSPITKQNLRVSTAPEQGCSLGFNWYTNILTCLVSSYDCEMGSMLLVVLHCRLPNNVVILFCALSPSYFGNSCAL